MNLRLQAGLTALALTLVAAIAPTTAHANAAAMNACATTLSPDAKAIFDKTLPQLAPNSDLRAVLTSTTRSLAISGAISRGNARQSATAAAKCLEKR